MRTLRSLLSWVPAALWYSVIWYFSSQPGDTSADVSASIMEGALISGGSDYSSASEVVRLAISWILSFFIRKGAHMFLFFVLTLLVWMALTGLLKARHVRAAAAAAICVLLASLDEYHQTLVPGRSGKFGDVMVDLTGMLIALLLLTLPWLSRQLRHRLAHPERLWTAGAALSAALLVWVGTLQGVAIFFIHRANRLEFFMWMDDAYFRALLDACAPILRQALYLASCGAAGFVCVLPAALSDNRSSVKAALICAPVLCILTALVWELPLLPGAVLALAGGLAAVVIWKVFPLLQR